MNARQAEKIGKNYLKAHEKINYDTGEILTYWPDAFYDKRWFKAYKKLKTGLRINRVRELAALTPYRIDLNHFAIVNPNHFFDSNKRDCVVEELKRRIEGNFHWKFEIGKPPKYGGSRNPHLHIIASEQPLEVVNRLKLTVNPSIDSDADFKRRFAYLCKPFGHKDEVVLGYYVHYKGLAHHQGHNLKAVCGTR